MESGSQSFQLFTRIAASWPILSFRNFLVLKLPFSDVVGFTLPENFGEKQVINLYTHIYCPFFCMFTVWRSLSAPYLFPDLTNFCLRISSSHQKFTVSRQQSLFCLLKETKFKCKPLPPRVLAKELILLYDSTYKKNK